MTNLVWCRQCQSCFMLTMSIIFRDDNVYPVSLRKSLSYFMTMWIMFLDDNGKSISAPTMSNLLLCRQLKTYFGAYNVKPVLLSTISNLKPCTNRICCFVLHLSTGYPVLSSKLEVKTRSLCKEVRSNYFRQSTCFLFWYYYLVLLSKI
jgi:hypothetical protein